MTANAGTRQTTPDSTRLAVDIGGTFTDVVLEHRDSVVSTKVLTTHRAPDDAVMTGLHQVLQTAGVQPADLQLALHGTTLATNALIERKGAKTALLTTAGFRDILEMGFEKRFAQYNLDARRPAPLVPRQHRFTVTERISASGKVIEALDTTAIHKLANELQQHQFEAIAIGFLHAYAHPQHEQAAADILATRLPEVAISLSSEVCPELREYERFSTTVANAYVQPLMAGYLQRLQNRLAATGVTCPLFMMQSGGGLTTLEQAMRLPIRLVESGPAGGAILAADVAMSRGLASALAFDMGGTTAKLALIENGQPDRSRRFEIARAYRGMKGSGLPVRIPVIEMVEIGAGGGSIARVDNLSQIRVGPDSAGSEPGPIAYAQGGQQPTVTDANLLLGKIDAERFAAGTLTLDTATAAAAVQQLIGDQLALDGIWPAAGIVEIVEENMANAARVHAVERGKEPSEYSMIAFGGGAPLHAARLADKLGIDRVVIPPGAGVGSAIGFLKAPVSYQMVKTYHCILTTTDLDELNDLLDTMYRTALQIVQTGAGAEALTTRRQVELRYQGQGHELSVDLSHGRLTTEDLEQSRIEFEARYLASYGLTMPEATVECVSWSVTVATKPRSTPPISEHTNKQIPDNDHQRSVYDAVLGKPTDYTVYSREQLSPGDQINGPAIVAEDETSTLIPTNFNAAIDSGLAIVLTRN